MQLHVCGRLFFCCFSFCGMFFLFFFQCFFFDESLPLICNENLYVIILKGMSPQKQDNGEPLKR